jgi:regulator of replication initiation timing
MGPRNRGVRASLNPRQHVEHAEFKADSESSSARRPEAEEIDEELRAELNLPICSLTQVSVTELVDPVTASDGRIYEGSGELNIRNVLRLQPRSPMTNEPMTPNDIFKNYDLNDLILSFKKLETKYLDLKLMQQVGNISYKSALDESDQRNDKLHIENQQLQERLDQMTVIQNEYIAEVRSLNDILEDCKSISQLLLLRVQPVRAAPAVPAMPRREHHSLFPSPSLADSVQTNRRRI